MRVQASGEGKEGGSGGVGCGGKKDAERDVLWGPQGSELP